MKVAEAYLACREIARGEAKNFYYAFRVLPRYKSDAMCAVYAFMRRADDLADDESLTVAERRVRMAAWSGAWRAVQAGGASEDAVFVAVRETQERFGISDELLDQLVEGTAMDLEPSAGTQVYANFAELYRYCYLVASVVGLVSIRIFGYTDGRAEKLAEETGVAFQLTNILRDVKEDVERGRVYLPLDLLEKFGVSLERVRELAAGAVAGGGEGEMLVSLGARAEAYYGSAARLLPKIDRDSRAALWVMVKIYHELLGKILAAGEGVFIRRVALSRGRKMVILGQGMVMAAWYRVTS